MTDLRSHLVVTADASAIPDEARKGATGLGELRRAAVETGNDLDALAAKGDKAASSAAVFTTALDRQEQSFRALQSSLDPGMRAMEEYEAAQASITRAVLTGVAAEAEGARALDQLTARYDAFVAAQQRARPSSGSARDSAGVFEAAAADERMLAERLEADSRAFRALEESLSPATRAAREFAEARQLVSQAQTSGAISNTRAAQTLQQLTAREQEHNRSQSAAAQSAAAMERAIEEEARAYNALRLSLDPVARATEELQRERDQLTRAVRLGIATDEEAARSLQLLEARHEALTRAQVGGAAGARSFGMGIQNASYQFTDIAVQLQGGQALTLVLAQQLPQLLGGFGALGAVLGLTAALGVPLISMFLSGGEAAGDLDDRITALEKSLGNVKDSLAILRDESLSSTFGNMSGDVREMTSLLLELNRAAELKNLRDTLDKLLRDKIEATAWDEVGQALTGSRGAPALNRDQLTRRNFDQLTEGRGLDYDQFAQRRGEIDALAQAGETTRVIAEIKRLMQDMAAGGPVTEINNDLLSILLTLGDVAQKTAEMEASFNGTAEASQRYVTIVEGANAALARVAEVEKTLKENTEERIRIAENELALAQAVAAFGEDSAEAEAERASIARENYEMELERAGIYGEQLEDLMRTYDATAAVTEAGKAWADGMAAVRAEVDGILAAIASLGGGMVDRAAKAAELRALNAGGTIADAAATGRATRREAEFNARSAGAGVFGRAAAGVQRWWDESGDSLDSNIGAARDAARRRERSGGGGRGGGGGGSAGLGTVADIKGELARLRPSYEADVEAAEAWRDKALASLSKTKAGYAGFADDVDAIFQERLAKAYEADLKRRDDWQSGLQRGLLEIEDSFMSWADLSENLVTEWSEGLEDAFVKMTRTGKLEVGDLVDYTLEQFARLAFQKGIQPAISGLVDWVSGAVGGFFGGGGSGSATSISTNHTGSPGVQRSYNLGGAGDSMRSDERLTMMRKGEEIMTSRALENAGALISAMTALAAAPAKGGGGSMNIAINNASGAVRAEARQTADGGLEIDLFEVIERKMAGRLATGRGPLAAAMSSTYNLRPQYGRGRS